MASNAGTDRLSQIVRRAEQAAAAGNVAEAKRLVADATRLAADSPLVLNASVMIALNEGKSLQARELALQAVAGDARNAAFWINLASANRQMQLPDDELLALDKALALEPRNILALLQKASLFDLRGKPRAAASTYQSALQTMLPGAPVPPFLEVAVRRAIDRVRANEIELASFLSQRLVKAAAWNNVVERRRFDHCIDTLLGKRAIYRPQPTFMYFPSLPTYEFYERSDFTWLDRVEAASAIIRTELEAVLAAEATELKPYVQHPEGVPLDQWAELNNSVRWSAYYLWKSGVAVEPHIAQCPQTAELMRQVPLVAVSGNAPNVFFSILKAQTRIPAHTGVTNTRLVVHLPLIVPPQCGFRVGSEVRAWVPGQAWVFDDTIEHEAWNDSDVSRAILIFDIWNPYLKSGEQELVRRATEAIGEYYGDLGRAPYDGDR